MTIKLKDGAVFRAFYIYYIGTRKDDDNNANA
jgi:hypothetical protein